jgi:two-component system LytT family response regulator
VVDDEDLARRQVIRLLAPYQDELAVIGEASNGCEALEMMLARTPDVVFLDVEMPGMSGLDAVRQLRVQPLLVLTTAHQQYALRAFEENTIDYLLKPIEALDMSRAIGKLRRWAGRGDPARMASISPGKTASESDCLLVPSRDVIRPVPMRDIVYLEARDKYVELHTERESYLLVESLGDLEVRLPPNLFVRVHRNCIVNIRFIRELHRFGNRTLRLVLAIPTPTDILVSRRSVDDLLARLERGR